jgi:hypothetical protein
MAKEITKDELTEMAQYGAIGALAAVAVKKYNENHDEAGRFASGSDSPGGKAAEKMNATALKTVLDSHTQWLEGKPGGKQANLRGAHLQEADLHGANLRGANLSRADLQMANLHRADLHGANLQEADLYGANLRGANMQEANLQGAIRYSDAPLGWKVVDNHLEHAEDDKSKSPDATQAHQSGNFVSKPKLYDAGKDSGFPRQEGHSAWQRQQVQPGQG